MIDDPPPRPRRVFRLAGNAVAPTHKVPLAARCCFARRHWCAQEWLDYLVQRDPHAADVLGRLLGAGVVPEVTIAVEHEVLDSGVPSAIAVVVAHLLLDDAGVCVHRLCTS